jgi:hypothetical protein
MADIHGFVAVFMQKYNDAAGYSAWHRPAFVALVKPPW